MSTGDSGNLALADKKSDFTVSNETYREPEILIVVLKDKCALIPPGCGRRARGSPRGSAPAPAFA